MCCTYNIFHAVYKNVDCIQQCMPLCVPGLKVHTLHKIATIEGFRMDFNWNSIKFEVGIANHNSQFRSIFDIKLQLCDRKYSNAFFFYFIQSAILTDLLGRNALDLNNQLHVHWWFKPILMHISFGWNLNMFFMAIGTKFIWIKTLKKHISEPNFILMPQKWIDAISAIWMYIFAALCVH